MKEPHALDESSHSTEMDCAFFTVDACRALLFLHKAHIPRGAAASLKTGDSLEPRQSANQHRDSSTRLANPHDHRIRSQQKSWRTPTAQDDNTSTTSLSIECTCDNV